MSIDDGTVLGDASCAEDGPKPSLTTTIENYEACTYRLEVLSRDDWSTTCGAQASRTVTYGCYRSNDGASVDVPRFCDSPDEVTEKADVYTGCSGAWSVAYSACRTDGTQSATTSCLSKQTQSPIDASQCNPLERPAPTSRPCPGTWSMISSTTCVGGSITPQVVCRSAGGSQLNVDQCNPSTRPTPAAQACVTNACPAISHGYFDVVTSDLVVVAQNVTTVADAQKACDSARSSGGPGVCSYNSYQSRVFYRSTSSGAVKNTGSSSHYASICK